MKIKREQVEKVLSRLSFDVRKLREQIRKKAPKDTAETPERIEKRKRNVMASTDNVAEANRRFERIIKGNDLININYLEKGFLASRSVGRIHVCDADGNVVGYGTGFLVAPEVLITNNHVLESIDDATNSFVEFDYELDTSGKDRPTHVFPLEPSRLFITSEPLDFTVVAVSRKSRNKERHLTEYGWLKLIAEEGKILTAEYVSIIQHPGGQRKQVAVRENKVIKIDPDVVWYATDTLQGSSGSPAFNNEWQVVALHHLGVPRSDEQGNWLTKTGQIWDPSMDESMVDWIANEGIRVSRIVFELQSQAPTHTLLAPIFTGKSPPPEVMGTNSLSSRPSTSSKPVISIDTKHEPGAREIALTVPLRIAISLGDGAQIAGVSAVDTATIQERISIDPDYTNRRGYDPDFLGSRTRRVPLPELSDELLANAAKLNDGGGYELKYNHFSVVMHSDRRLAIFTAVNIDGNQSMSLTRESDRWIYDERIPRESQCGEDLYARNDLDRGHLVRRLDPAWGESERIAKVANDDTFHFTNCSPQHKDFNQGKNLWAGLEDYVLENADTSNIRIVVFTGPVFRDDDREYRDVRIPAQFWKVIAAIGDDDRLYSTAYIVSQAGLVQALPREFTYGQYKTFQVRVVDIEALTGLDFGNLREVDAFRTNAGAAVRPRRGRVNEAFSFKSVGWQGLASLDEIQIPRRSSAPRRTTPSENALLEAQNPGRFSGTPKTEWLSSPAGPDRDMRLLEEFSYTDPNGRRWVAPAGSTINGASIPRALWSSVGSPYTDDYRCASIVHDVACDNQTIPRKEADQMFYHACIAGGCSVAQARVLYAGVRIGAWSSSLQGVIGSVNELTPFRSTEAVSRDVEVKRKFDDVVSRISKQERELTLSELDRIVDETLAAPLPAATPGRESFARSERRT